MNVYELTVNTYNKLIHAVYTDETLLAHEKFQKQIELKLKWEPIIAKAFLAELQK